MVSVFTIPFIVNASLLHFIEEGKLIQLSVLETIIKIMAIVIVPVSIGMWMNYYSPNFAKKMSAPVRKASAIVLLLVILGILVKERNNMLGYFEQAGLVALSLNVSSMLVGLFTAKLFQIRYAQAVSIAIESGIQNGTMAITIATVMLANTSYAVAPAIYSVLMFFTGIVVIFWSSRKMATLR